MRYINSRFTLHYMSLQQFSTFYQFDIRIYDPHFAGRLSKTSGNNVIELRTLITHNPHSYLTLSPILTLTISIKSIIIAVTVDCINERDTGHVRATVLANQTQGGVCWAGQRTYVRGQTARGGWVMDNAMATLIVLFIMFPM